MARYTDSVCRMCRREGTKLFLKGEKCFSSKCAQQNRPTPPASMDRPGSVRRASTASSFVKSRKPAAPMA